VRSSIVGALQRKYFLWKSSQVEYLRNSANRNFGKALGLFQSSYWLNNGVLSITMD
jgi:hypothetical protein